jgi:hypothetical protein
MKIIGTKCEDPGSISGSMKMTAVNTYDATVGNLVETGKDFWEKSSELVGGEIDYAKNLWRGPNKIINAVRLAVGSVVTLPRAANSLVSGVVKVPEVLVDKGLDAMEGLIHTTRNSVRKSLGRIPVIGRFINLATEFVTIVNGTIGVNLMRIVSDAVIKVRRSTSEKIDEVLGNAREKIGPGAASMAAPAAPRMPAAPSAPSPADLTPPRPSPQGMPNAGGMPATG